MANQTIAQQFNIKNFPFRIMDGKKLVYIEQSNGNWTKYKYEEDNNRVIHIEQSNGNWKKWKLDDENVEIYYDSNGFFSVQIWDKEGNSILYAETDSIK